MKNEEISDSAENGSLDVIDSIVLDSIAVDSVIVDSAFVDFQTGANDFFDDCDLVVRDFIPEVFDFDFYIEGRINDKFLRYTQYNADWSNSSNTYLTEHHWTSLQAYSDTVNRKEYWTIDITDVDLTNISLPYRLEEWQGSIGWYDNRVDQTIENLDMCQGVDSGCKIWLSSTNPNNSIVITSVANQIIEGEFSGKGILKRTGLIFGWDSTICYPIYNGKFKINYRIK